MDNDPKHAHKSVTKLLKDNKVKVLEWPSKALTSIQYKNCGQNRKGVCEQGGLQTRLSYTSSLRSNTLKIPETDCEKLGKGNTNCFTQVYN